MSQSILPEKRVQKLFFTGKFAFFQKFVFQQPLRCYRNDLVTCTVFGRTPCRPLQIVPWGFLQSILWKKGPKVFYLLENLPFFQKFVSSTTSWVLQKWSCNSLSNCEYTSCTLIKCPRRFVTFDSTRKKGPNFFFSGKIVFLFKKLCLQQPRRSWGNDLITCTINARTPWF